MNASFQSNNSFRDLVSNENVFLAPIIRWNISPRTQATLEMEYQHQNHSQNTQVIPFDINNNRIIDNLPHSRNLGERNRIETETIFLGFNWSHQFNDDWSIKNQVVYKREDNKLGVIAFPVDIKQQTGLVDRGLVGPLQHNIDQVATILDLTGHFKTWGLEHTLLMGGDYYNFKSFQNGGGGPNSSINLDNPVHPGPGLNLAVSDNSQSPFNSDNYGLYAQDQIKLPYHLHVMGGLRYQYVHQTNGNGSAGNVVFDSQTDDAVTPRVGLLWQPQKWLSLYSNYAENFGANTGRGFQNKSLPPESARQWEVGAKTEFFDGRLRATLAYYDLTKQNVATKDTVHQKNPFCVGNGGCVAAVGEVRSRGSELDIQGELLPGWNVIATYANQDVRVSKSNDTAASGSTNLVGNRLQFVPRNIGTFWSTYEVQKGDLKGFKVGGGVTVQDGVVDATNAIKSPGYALVNLLAGYSFEVGKSKITAQLNVDNLLDKSYFTNASAFGNVGYVTFSTPRTFMGSINVQY
jgi:iron complex outermembrane recepter protein